MKKSIYILAVFGIFILASCCKPKLDKNGPCREGFSKAILTGYDTRKCACCGGLMLTFTNDSRPYSSEYYLVESLPGGTGINDGSKFPIQVCVKVEKVLSDCGNTQRIRVLQLERTN